MGETHVQETNGLYEIATTTLQDNSLEFLVFTGCKARIYKYDFISWYLFSKVKNNYRMASGVVAISFPGGHLDTF